MLPGSARLSIRRISFAKSFDANSITKDSNYVSGETNTAGISDYGGSLQRKTDE